MKKLFLILFGFLPFLIKADVVTRVKFYSGSFPTAKSKAKVENRPYFVEFMASWCGPCHVMDNTTFNDPNLANYIAQNYIAVKIDVDDFDGYVYRQQYNIKSVPTFLIYSPTGKLLERYTGSISGSSLLAKLKKHDKWTSMSSSTTTTPSTSTSSSNSTTTHHTTKPKPTNDSVKKGSGLFRFKVENQPSKGYSVQVGVYAKYENVLREVNKFQKIFDEPILVHIDKLRNKTVYRVLIGELKKESQAAKLQKQISGEGISSFVVNLKQFN